MKDQKTKKIPPGYKQTELGIIPEDWEVKRLGDIFDIEEKVKRECKIHKQKIYALLTVKLYAKGIIIRELVRGRMLIGKKLYLVNEGDFIFSKIDVRNGAWGFVGHMNFTSLISGDFPILRLKSQLADRSFVQFYISKKSLWSYLQNISEGTTNRQRIGSSELLKNAVIILPPLPEQQAIARVLSDVDELIESLSKLIEKKKNIKKGAMQELLTGKRRLPGFGVGRGYKQTELGVIPEDWEVKKLGDLGDLYAGGTPSTSNPLYWNGPIIWLQSGRIQNNVIKKLDNEITITEEGLKNSAAKLIRKNSVLIAITGATCGNVAFLPFEATANQSVVSVVTNHNNIAKFLYHKLLSERPKILQLQNGSAQGGVNLNSLKKIQLFTPPLPEQQAIARVLSDMDEEIEALEKKKAKYENLKKAMMQVLLTGKIRLKNFAKV